MKNLLNPGILISILGMLCFFSCNEQDAMKPDDSVKTELVYRASSRSTVPLVFEDKDDNKIRNHAELEMIAFNADDRVKEVKDIRLKYNKEYDFYYFTFETLTEKGEYLTVGTVLEKHNNELSFQSKGGCTHTCKPTSCSGSCEITINEACVSISCNCRLNGSCAASITTGGEDEQ